MKAYITALAVGLLVGVFYGLLKVRSPAPPYVTLLGLLGILIGEQAVPLVKGWLWPSTQVASSKPNDDAA